MRRKSLACIAASLVFATLAPLKSADATVVRGFSLPGLSSEAHAIVRGTVIHQETVYDARWRRVYTHSWIRVEDRLWGPSDRGDLIVIRQIGGELDGVLSMVVGTARMFVGDEVVAFTRQGDGLHYLVGMAQGLYHVDRSNPAQPRLSRGVGGIKMMPAVGPYRTVARDRMTLEQLVDSVERVNRDLRRAP